MNAIHNFISCFLLWSGLSLWVMSMERVGGTFPHNHLNNNHVHPMPINADTEKKDHFNDSMNTELKIKEDIIDKEIEENNKIIHIISRHFNDKNLSELKNNIYINLHNCAIKELTSLRNAASTISIEEINKRIDEINATYFPQDED